MNLNNFFNNSMTKKFFCTLKNGHFAPGNQLFKMAISRAIFACITLFCQRKNLKKLQYRGSIEYMYTKI